MPSIELRLGTFDPTKANPDTWPQTDEAQIDASNGHLVTRKEAKEYTGGAPGAIVITEVEAHGYGVATNDALAQDFANNQQAGDGIYDIVIFNSSLKDDAEAQIQAESELALRTADKGSFGFDTFEDVNIGEIVPYTDTEDNENHDWPIQELSFSVVGNQLKKSVKCSPLVEKTLGQLATEAFKASKSAPPVRQIDLS